AERAEGGGRARGAGGERVGEGPAAPSGRAAPEKGAETRLFSLANWHLLEPPLARAQRPFARDLRRLQPELVEVGRSLDQAVDLELLGDVLQRAAALVQAEGEGILADELGLLTKGQLRDQQVALSAFPGVGIGLL